MFHKRHFLDSDTECGTRVGVKTEYNLGHEVEFVGVEYKRRETHREKAPQLNTKLQMCGAVR